MYQLSAEDYKSTVSPDPNTYESLHQTLTLLAEMFTLISQEYPSAGTARRLCSRLRVSGSQGPASQVKLALTCRLAPKLVQIHQSGANPTIQVGMLKVSTSARGLNRGTPSQAAKRRHEDEQA
jgi:hypothetical protein